MPNESKGNDETGSGPINFSYYLITLILVQIPTQ